MLHFETQINCLVDMYILEDTKNTTTSLAKKKRNEGRKNRRKKDCMKSLSIQK